MGDSSSFGFNVSEEVKDGGMNSTHVATTSTTSTLMSSIAIAPGQPKNADFRIAGTISNLVATESAKEHDVANPPTNVITPYNFLTSATIEKGVIDATSASSTTIYDLVLPQPHHQQQPRKRKPSATITSGSLLASNNDDEQEFLVLPANIKTELNPTVFQQTTTHASNSTPSSTSTVTTIKTERTTVETRTTEKYHEFGIPLDPVRLQPRTGIGLMLNSNKVGLENGAGGDADRKGGLGTQPFVPVVQMPDPKPPVIVQPPPVQAPTTNPIADDVVNWVPFPVPRRKKSSPFTPFQLEQLNHQMRMYTLANRLTIITKKDKKPTQPRTRARGKVTPVVPPDEPEWLDPVVTRTRGGGKKNVQVMTVPPPFQLPVPPPPPQTAKRGRKRINDAYGNILDPLAPPPPPPQTAKRGRKRINDAYGNILDPLAPPPKPREVARKSTSKGMRILIRDAPLVFVECTFCATSIPVFDSLTIESCQHIFCRECLRNFIENNSEPQIPCPIRDEAKCNGVLSDPEIKGLVNEEIFEKYLSRSLTSALEADSQLTHCFFPGCSGICLIEDGLRRFYCPVCSKLNCLDCKTTHESPCKKKRRKTTEEDHGVIDLVDDSDEDGDGDVEGVGGQIAMKLPVAETEAEAKLRTEWEASWEQLVAKFNTTGKEGLEGESNGKKTKLWKESVSHLEVFSELITTDHVFECPICFVDVEVGEGVILQECFHRFCRDCLAASIQHADEPRVKCPYQSGNYSCQMHILDREVKSLVSDEVYDKLLKKSLSAAEMGMSNAFHCQSVNCSGWAEIDERVATFRCFICTKTNCVPCKAIHDGMACAEYQSRLREGEFDVASKEELNRMISKGDAMRCPTCKVVIIKNGGCDGMTCVVCQTHICWATKGPRWGPKGRGDETGGCRCGFEGKKCHPKCGNCH